MNGNDVLERSALARHRVELKDTKGLWDFLELSVRTCVDCLPVVAERTLVLGDRAYSQTLALQASS